MEKMFTDRAKSMEDMFAERARKRSANTNKYAPEQIMNTQPVNNLSGQQEVEPGVIAELMRGFGRSSIATPFIAPSEQQAPTFGGRLVETIGELGGDIAPMYAGGVGGALGGAALGAPFGPVGMGIGALLGGGAGSFALPEAVKSIARQIRKGAGWGESTQNVLKDVTQSGLVGAATGAAGKLAAPFVKAGGGKVGAKILESGFGKGAVEAAGELAGLTGAQKFLGGDPSLEDIAQNALLIAGMRGAGVLKNKFIQEKPLDVGGLLPKKSPLRTSIENMVKDHVGDKNARVVESDFNWRERLKKAQEKGEFTPENLEDMIYYRQKTGNPKLGEDTFEGVSKRLPENAKKFVDTIIDKHFEDTLRKYNEDPYTKKITPREALEDIYLPGIYEFTKPEFNKAYRMVSKQFKTSNPFAKPKKYLDYMMAFKEAGLKPKYNNIVDIMRAYDQTMIKSLTNSKFIHDLKHYEKGSQKNLMPGEREPFIVRSVNKKQYQRAKETGYVPFMDPYLRQHVAGITEDKTPIHTTTTSPALVHPEIAPAIQRIFNKEAYTPDSTPMKYYDYLTEKMRSFHVRISPFHYVALTEHAVPALQSVNIPRWMKEGRELRNNKEFMMDAARSGLTMHGGDTKSGYLFREFQPNIKALTWDGWVQTMLDKEAKQGNPLSKDQIKNVKRDMATFVNNVYGGQNFETMQFFNDPKNLKTLRRLIAYPDWSVSAIKNAASIFAPGHLGEAARKTWFNYALFYFGTRALMDAFYKSFKQTDPDLSPMGIQFSPEEFMNNLHFVGEGPTQWYQFQMPDVPVKIAGYEFNPGRDTEGHKQYGHLGKSALEIAHYFNKPMTEIFSKSNPVLQAIFKQVVGATPSEGGLFPVQGAYKHGKQVPWGGTEPHTLDRFMVRAQELGKEVLPFSVRGSLPESITGEKGGGLGKYIGSAGGAHPVTKGLSLYKATPYLEQAIKRGDEQRVEQLTKILKDNGYNDKEIKKRISLLRNEIKKHAH
jgi:hypothetical protein